MTSRGYLGLSAETTASLWPGLVRAWADYLASGRHGSSVVDDLVAMDDIVQVGLNEFRSAGLDRDP